MAASPTKDPDAFDPTVPNEGRMYDFYLGGKDNFAADREAALQALEVAPDLRELVREARRFLARAVRFLAEAGIRQFIDIGTGLPTQGNVHEIAQAVAPDARVVYVDNDPIVRVHAEALLEGNELATVLQADMRDPDQILKHPDLLSLIDLDEPVAILLFFVLYTVPEDDRAMRIVRHLRDAMCPGSYLAVSHPVSDICPETTARLAVLYQEQAKVIEGTPRHNVRTRAEVARFLDGLELVEPGVVYLPDWRPPVSGDRENLRSIWAVGGVGRKN
jgi:S-adenosyl methyltransferase